MSEQLHVEPGRRTVITLSAVLASAMVVMDSTIAGVALPHMQASTGATSSQIMWVMTSYMVATAIALPLSGWLASRFGKKPVMLVSLAGFTLASMACGIATSLAGLVLARTLQGIAGAGLQPVTQAVLLSINPRERHTRVLAYQSMSSMLGPLFAPTLGGWLTDTLSWRWVFFINLPVGLLAFIGLLAFLPRDRDLAPIRFDMFGFAALALAVAALQLFLDRGEQLDWLDSPEIIFWAVAACMGLYFTVVHTLTSRSSFIPRALFRDWNFLVASFLGTAISIASFGSQPLITFMMQQLMGYSALRSGTLVAIASLSSMIGVIVIATPLNRLGVRLIIAIGMLLLGWSQVLYASLSLYADEWPIVVAGIIKGAGVGLMMTMLPGITFSTLPAHLRNEGAAFSALVRNMGMSVGVTLTQILAVHETGVVRARLVEGVRPDNPLLHYAMPGFDFNSLPSVAAMGGEISRQAVMVGYIDAFLAAGILAFLIIPTVMLIRVRR